VIFLHRRYQTSASVGPVDVYLSDLAVMLVAAAALAAGIRDGWQPLERGRLLWAVAAGLLALMVLSCFYTPFDRATTHLVTALKIVEYATLAPALVLLLRRARDVRRFLWALVACSVAASTWGVLQFLGVVNEFEGKRPGQREPSFVGIHDFAALSGAALVIAIVGIVLGRPRWAALVAGAVGAVLAASIFAYSGIVLAAGFVVLAARRSLTLRRAVAVASVVAAVGLGVLALRSYDTSHFLSFLGVKKSASGSSEDVQTGSQRAMLGYIGVRLWRDHPLLGVGFERSGHQYGPYLADARRRFPDEPALAFPSPRHEWGVQNFWIQAAADMGIAGLALAAGTVAAGLALALRARGRTALVAGGWILVVVGTWNGVGIVAGIPLQALTWMALGLAVVAGGVDA
jgi:O-Antigen ligase